MFDDPEDQYFQMMDSAKYTGRAARLAGRPIEDCPYEDRRLVSAWREGWRSAPTTGMDSISD